MQKGICPKGCGGTEEARRQFAQLFMIAMLVA